MALHGCPRPYGYGTSVSIPMHGRKKSASVIGLLLKVKERVNETKNKPAS